MLPKYLGSMHLEDLMKKKIAIALAFIVAIVGIIYLYKKENESTPVDSEINLHRLSSASEEDLKNKVDREVDRGLITDLPDLELMEKLYPDNKAYKKAIFNTYYDQDPNKGLQYAGKVFMETGDRELLKLLADKTSKTFKYSQDSRYEVIKELAEETASRMFGSWKDVFLSPYYNADAPYYLKNTNQVELMDGSDGNLYILVYGATPLQETISKGKKVPANEAEIYKIRKDGQVDLVKKVVNDESAYREIIFRKVGPNIEFSQASSIINLQSEIAFFASSTEEISKANQEILNNLEHNSLNIDWTGYENLAPFAKAYMEEVFKIKNLNAKNSNGDGKSQSLLKKGFLVDLDQDGVLDLVLLTSNFSDTKKTQGLYIYTYANNQAIKIYQYEDTITENSTYNFHLDAGLYEEDGKTFVFLAHTADSGYFVTTNLGLLSKAKGENKIYQEEGYSNVGYMTYLSADGTSNQYEESSFVENSTFIKPNTNESAEEGYYKLRDKLFGPDSNFFITDAKAKVDPKTLAEGETGVEGFEYPARDKRGNLIYEAYDNFLTEDQLLSLLLIPVEQPVDFPIIRRFRIGDQIFPAEILKIRADSTGHINASIFKDQDQVALRKDGDNLVIEKDNKTYTVENPMMDEEGNYYVPFATFKEMGIIAKDQDYIVDLSFDGSLSEQIQGETYEAIKDRVDQELSRGGVKSIRDLELISALEDDFSYKEERIKYYYGENPDKAYYYGRYFYGEEGNSLAIKALDTKDLEILSDQDKLDEFVEDLDDNTNLIEANKAYLNKLLDLYEKAKDSKGDKETAFSIDSGLFYDLDGDGVEEFILKLSLDDELIILAYTYDPDDESLVQIFSESINRRLNQKLEYGVGGQEKTFFILEDYKDDLSRTSLKTYKFEDGELSLDCEVYKTLKADSKEDPIYTFSKKDEDNDRDAEKTFKDLREELFGTSEIYFYSDGQAKNVLFSKYPDFYRLDFESLFKYLLIPENLDFYPAIIRRFKVDDIIYPQGTLKISPESKGYVDLRVLKAIPQVDLKNDSGSFVLKIADKSFDLKDLIEDEDGNSYLSLEEVKDLGLLKEDRGPIILLGK